MIGVAVVALAASIACANDDAHVDGHADARTIHVGSKAFTEGVILGELAAALLENAGFGVEHHRQLGGTRLVFSALESGSIDVYAEYTGTLTEEIFANQHGELGALLAEKHLRMTKPLGFNNTYGIAMRADVADKLHVERISDLAAHPELRFGLSNEFLDRKDGWPALAKRYQLVPRDVRGLDHDVAYKALTSGAVDAVDCYTTDAEIAHFGLRVLDDDLHYFPRYDAVFLYRADLPARAVDALSSLAGRISEREMSMMNARARVDHVPESDVARDFLSLRAAPPPHETGPTRTARLVARTKEHVVLVALALALSILIGLPLGVIAAKNRRVGQAVLAVVGVVQTLPSIAVLVLFVPLAGIGTAPAVIAMILYGLLPIARNTHAGLTNIAPALKDSAHALGLSSSQRLFAIELPLASPSILAGIQTSATIGVGTATIGALVGAGGYGQSILTGIRLDDTALILEGALPAAAMAVAMQALFALVERFVVPAGLRAR